MVPAIFIGTLILIGALASLAKDGGRAGLSCLLAPIGIVLVSVLILMLGDAARVVASDVPQWSQYWALERGALWIDGGRIRAESIESAAYFGTSDLDMPMVEIRVAGQYVDLTVRHKLYLPCDPAMAEAAWRCVERQRQSTDGTPAT